MNRNAPGHGAQGDPATRTCQDGLKQPGSLHFDGAAYYHATLYEGTLGAPRHAAESRWDWSVTLESLRLACDRDARLRKLAEGLTPEQRMAVWSDGS